MQETRKCGEGDMQKTGTRSWLEPSTTEVQNGKSGKHARDEPQIVDESNQQRQGFWWDNPLKEPGPRTDQAPLASPPDRTRKQAEMSNYDFYL